MSKLEIKLDLKGINEMMKSSEIQSHLNEAGEMVANASGLDCKVETKTINWIAVTNIATDTPKAYYENLKNNTLLKALGSVGLSMSK